MWPEDDRRFHSHVGHNYCVLRRVLYNGLGEVAAGISVAGPAHRLSEDVMRQIATDVIAAAKAISVSLGSGR